MIELHNVTKYFKSNRGRKYIMRNVNLTIPSGVNVGILGRNGAGKSTMMRMLGQIEFPNKGKIISSNSFSWPLALSTSFVPGMTGRANVKFVCKLYGKNDAEVKSIIEYVKEFSELNNYFDMPISSYSSGMRSRLSFGLSLSFDFDYLLIDETLSTGDTRFKGKATKALQEKIEKCNVLLVGHQMKILQDICHAGIVLNDGNAYYFDNINDAVNVYEDINKSKEN